MKALKFILIILFCQAGSYEPLYAGDIAADSVPTEINYQGRLEKDNAPITGPIHITFRIYDALTGGNLEWESGEMVINAVQGIFSASIEPSWSVFATTEDRYLEVQIESDVLSPREPFQSAAFALVSKRLEDGSNISISSMTTTGSVTVNNNITIGPAFSANGIFFPDGSFMSSSNIGSANNLSALTDAVIVSDSNNDGFGNIIFRTGSITESARITDAGNLGIGNTPAAGRKLDVDGSLYIGTEGIYDRDDAEINIMENLGVAGGIITGDNSESISIGVTDDVIALTSGGSERMRVHSNGYVGIGLTSPSAMLHVSGDIVSDDGARGGSVSIGDYTGWTSLNNEIRAAAASHLLLQHNNALNVGIGLIAPTEKLHVHGSIKADNGIIASTAAFSGNVTILGNLNANNPLGSNVELSSTVIYGTLRVTGGIGSDQGYPAYLISSQTFSGENTFLGAVTVSNDIMSSAIVAAGAINYNFGAGKYLQIGDNSIGAFVNDDALVYLVAGESADSKIHFYRGENEAARLETQSGNNLAMVVSGEEKAFIDASSFRIFNSEFYVSAAKGTTPAIYVSPAANVSMGTTTTDPNWQLTVDGNIRISGSVTNGIIFADGSSMTTSSATSAGSLSNNDDVLIRSDADNVGGGDIIINAGSVNGIFVNSGGNIGMGTQSPISKLNIRGGDLVLGNPYLDSYGGNGVEDLIIEGSLVVDGGIVQRSASPVYLAALTVAGDVFLSTTAAARTGIGNITPGYRLDVTDDINASGNILTGGTQRISATGVLGSGGADATWDGVTIAVNRGGTGATALTGVLHGNGTGAFTASNVVLTSEVSGTLPVGNGGTGATSLTSGGILYGGGSGAISAMNVLTNGQLLIGDGTTAPTAATLTGTTNRVTVSNGAGTITLSLPQDIDTGASPTFSSVKASSGIFTGTGATQYSLYLSSGISISAGTLKIPEGASVDYVLSSDASGNASWKDPSTSGYGDNVVGNEVRNATNGTLTRSGLGTTGNPYTLAIDLGNENTWTANIVMGNNYTVDGVDISDYSAFFIHEAGSSGNVWKSDGSGRGGWGTDNTNDTVAGSELNGLFSNGILLKTGVNTFSQTANNSSNWDDAYTQRRQWDGGSTNLNASNGRTNLGLGSGLTTTIYVRNQAGDNFCELNVTNGIITGTDCP